MLEEYSSLIADKSKRQSLIENEIIQFQFNSNVRGFKFVERFYSELAQVVIDDYHTPSVAEGFFVFENVGLTVRVKRIRQVKCFDKFLIGIKRYGEDFVFDDSIEIVTEWGSAEEDKLFDLELDNDN